MRLFISKRGFCFSGKVSELRQQVRLWTQSNATLQEFLTLSLH